MGRGSTALSKSLKLRSTRAFGHRPGTVTYPVPNTPIPKSNSYAVAVDPRLCSYHLMGQHVSQDGGGGTQDAQSLRGKYVQV